MMDHKVRLESSGNVVIFQASSPVAESRSANYEGYNIVHLPTSMWAYRNTNGRHFSISGKLVSRNANEATANAAHLSSIRSWILPDFGGTGSTPPLVYFTAYNNKDIQQIPCIMVSYSWSFPDDIDYVYGGSEPMPVIGVVTVELDEAYSAEQITAGAWRINPRGGGGFNIIGEPGTASSAGVISTTSVPYGTGFGGLAASTTSLSTLGGLITISPGTIANLPQMAGAVAAAAGASPLATTIVREAVGLFGNRFINGSTPQQVYNNSSISTPPFNPNPYPVNDSFGRSTPAVTRIVLPSED